MTYTHLHCQIEWFESIFQSGSQSLQAMLQTCYIHLILTWSCTPMCTLNIQEWIPHNATIHFNMYRKMLAHIWILWHQVSVKIYASFIFVLMIFCSSNIHEKRIWVLLWSLPYWFRSLYCYEPFDEFHWFDHVPIVDAIVLSFGLVKHDGYFYLRYK